MSTMNLESPTTFSSAVLIGDVGNSGNASDSTPSFTEVGGIPVAAALELQSTNGGLLIPRMTSVQKAALTPLVDGMMVYDSDLPGFCYYQGGAWTTYTAETIQAATGTITAAQFQGMYAAPFELIPAQGANTVIKFHGASLELIWNTTQYTNAGAGNVYVQYSNTVHAGGTLLTAAITGANVTGANASRYYAFSFEPVIGDLADTANQGLYLSNTGAAYATGDSTFNWYVWYSVINVT
jgi:hypothetical protein